MKGNKSAVRLLYTAAIFIASANPPKYPDTMPKDNPSAMVQNAEQNAKATEDRAP